MRIRLSELRRLIREEVLLVEAQMSDPIAVAVGNALVNHMKSPAFASEVQKGLNGKKGDPDRAADELITTLPGSQLFREPIYAAVRAAAGNENALGGDLHKAHAAQKQQAPQGQQQTSQSAQRSVQQPSA